MSHPNSITPDAALGAGSDRGLAASRRRLAWFALGMGGWAFAGLVWVIGFQQEGRFIFPGGEVRVFYAFAGDAFRLGTDPYAINAYGTVFFYAPPWAAAFAMLSWAGPGAIHLVILVADLLALRYMARGWVRAGVLCWFLLVPWEMAAGQINLIVAASIVAAVRGTVWPAAITTLAKVSPALAVSRRDWRTFAIALAVCVVLTLPRLDLWPLWIERLLWGLGHPLGPLVPVPFLVRLPVAIGLVVWGRPWSRALGAVLATPGFYWASLVLLVAPAVVWLERPRPSSDAAPAIALTQ
jgi:hypothetical protein